MIAEVLQCSGVWGVSTEPRPRSEASASTARTQSLSDSAYERVWRQLVMCEFPPSATFTENDIAQALNMSKTPVREALRRVCLQGLAEVRSRTGYVAAPVTLKEARDVCELRRLLEGEAAALVAAEHPEVGAQRLSEVNAAVTAPVQVGSASDEAAGVIEADGQFHQELARLTGNNHLIRALENTLVHFSRLSYLCLTLAGTLVLELGTHADLIAAIGAGNNVRARELAVAEGEDAERRIVAVLIDSHSVASAPVSVVAAKHRFYLDTPRGASSRPGRTHETE